MSCPPVLAVFRDRYEIRQISGVDATAFLVPRHYLHRPGPCSLAFGLFDSENDEQVGAITYGTPSSSTLRRGLAGPEHTHNVAELTRLWVDDRVPRNGESFLIGNTVRRNTKELIVSFAEIDAGHVGTVYQATNWLYTGLSAKRTDWSVEGINLHGQTWGDKHTAAEMREIYGDRFSLKPRPRKHRYVFVNAKGGRRKALTQALRYPQAPYPKAHAQQGGQP